MATWIHFIGRQYYTRQEFVAEAEAVGVTRRVSMQTLKRMSFGDRVLLAIQDGKSAVIFGSFRVTTLSGLSKDAVDKIAAKVHVEVADSGRAGMTVNRGCGSYVVGFTFHANAELPELAALAAEAEDPGKPMVGGDWDPFPCSNGGVIRLKKVKHSQGFRLFDVATFLEDITIQRVRGKDHPAVKGFYYAKPEDDTTVAGVDDKAAVERLIESVQDYNRK